MKRRRNLFVWTGFVVTLAGFLSYFLFFYRFPITRDFPWANLLILAGGLILVALGVKRALAQPGGHLGKTSAVIAAILSVLVVSLFSYYNFYFAKQLPKSKGAPRVGDKAPDFILPDKNGNAVTLSKLLASPFDDTAGGPQKPNAVLLIFYRGYW